MAVQIMDLNPGERAVLLGYAESEGKYRRKLLSMGLTRGTEFRLVKTAPLGDPVEIEVRGFRLSLRKKEAEIMELGRAGR